MGTTRRAMLMGAGAVGALGGSPGRGRAASPLRIGAPLPLTGPLSPEGLKLRQGYDLWANQVNAKGGIKAGADARPIELVYYDYQSATPKAVQVAEKLATDDRVDFMFSPFGSGAAKAASTVSERYGIPTIAPTASSAEVYDQGYKNLFGTFTSNDTIAEPIATLIHAAAPGVRRVAILARNDLYPLALGQEFDKSAKARGMEVVYSGKYAINALDHASALTEIRAARPDWICATGYINDLILVRKQMADLGVTAQAITMANGPAYQEFVEALGPLAENLTTACWWSPAVRYISQDVFGSTEGYNRLFTAAYKTEPDYTAATGSAAGVLLQMAIERAGTADRAAVRTTLAAGGFDTFFGPLSFAKSGQVVSYVPPVMQVQGGKIVVILPDGIKQGSLRMGIG